MKEYYVYRHIRPDLNLPFYIGIGSIKDSKSHKAEYQRAYSFRKSQRSKFWYKVFEKCHREIEVEIMIEADSWNYIKEKEIEFITLYGRRDLGTGSLVNLTNGGDGTGGYAHKHSPETKLKISASSKGRIVSNETRQNMSNARKNIQISDAAKDRLRNLRKGSTASSETRHKMSLSQKEAWEIGKRKDYVVSDETRAKHSLAMTGKKNTPESNAKRSKAMKGYKFPIEFGLKISMSKKGKSNGREGYKHTQETLDKMSEARTKYWENKHNSKIVKQ